MDTEIQSTPPHENGAKVEESLSELSSEVMSNGNEDNSSNTIKHTNIHHTRSRSATPQKLKVNKNDENGRSMKEDAKVVPLKKVDEENTEPTENIGKDLEIKVHLKNDDKKEEQKTGENSKSKKEATKVSLSLKKNDAEKVENNEKKIKSSDLKERYLKKDDKKSSDKKKNNQDASNPEGLNKKTKKPEQKEKNKELLDAEVSKTKYVLNAVSEAVEMDPLVLATDEPDPELQFDETSDLESGKGSPIQVRCKTRRSQTRNIPTPKTPKSTDSESEKNSVAPTPDPSETETETKPENVNDTHDSINVEDISTRAEAGSDVTRLDYLAHNASITFEDQSYLNYSRERSLHETLRSLSPRKTIRPLNDSYRQRAFRNNKNKPDLNISYPSEDSVDRITGIKRKRSTTPEERKKFKADPPGFVSYIASPLNSFKNRFKPDINSSTPKLTGYKDGSNTLHEDITFDDILPETAEKKSWCAVM